MMCRCGHSFVEKPSERPRTGHMSTNTGCFVWMFLCNFLLGVGMTWMLFSAPEDRTWDGTRNLNWYPLISGIPSLVAAIGLGMRKRFGYNLAMVLCGINLLSIPIGTILAVVLMRGLSRDRHLFDA